MDLVQDQPFDTVELLLELGGLQDECQGFRRGDKDVRRVFEHLLTLVLGGVPRTDTYAYVRNREPVTFRHLPHLRQRSVEIPVDIIGECLERRYVDTIYALLQPSFGSITCQRIDYAHEGRERLTRTCRG